MSDIPVLNPEAPLTSFEIGFRLSATNSERRILQLGIVGLEADSSTEELSVASAHETYTGLIDGIRPFYAPSNFLLDLEHIPSGFVHIETPTKRAESTVTLTPRGLASMSLGGSLLALSHNSNVPLRKLLGQTHNLATPEDAERPFRTAQERYIALWSLLGRVAQRKSGHKIPEILEADEKGDLNTQLLDGVLPSWEEAGLTERTPGYRNANYWKFTEKGKMIQSDLLDVVDGHRNHDKDLATKGVDLLDAYLHDPSKRVVVNGLFRRDYIMTGARERAKVEKIARSLNCLLGDITPGTVFELGELAAITGLPLEPKALHRIAWWLGEKSPIVYDSGEIRRTYWCVANLRTPRDEHKY